MRLFNMTSLVMKFSHEISADKVVFMRTKDTTKTLLGQLEDEIDLQVREILKSEFDARGLKYEKP